MSQRRRNNIQRSSEGHDLTGQDQPMKDRSSWITGNEHQGDEYEDDEEDEEIPASTFAAQSLEDNHADARGRTTESAVVA